jgi:uncharacterized protein (DUF1697 family)
VTTSIALLRGVNVGGRKVSMSALRAALADGGYDDVVTYIQSGNMVLGHRRKSRAALEADLEAHVRGVAGFDVAVVVRSLAEWVKVVERNPFPGVEPTKLHVAFLKQRAEKSRLATIDVGAFAPEKLAAVGTEIYMHLPDGIGRAKLPPKLSVLGTPMTVRNWGTVTKLLALASR